MRHRAWISILGVMALGLAIPGAAQASESLVTNSSPSTIFPQNKQNEPYVAIDPSDPSVVAAGANEEIDNLPCSGSDCSFTPGVGGSGIYLSFNGGASWTQPEYTGFSGRSGTTGVGPIGTVPNYYEQGLVSDGDPSLAFGPTPGGNGNFSWSNGSRLYYANLTSNFNTDRQDFTFKGFEAIAVSHADDLAAAASGVNSAWNDPTIITGRKQSSATFSDKETIAADNVDSSPHFGNVYVCYSRFQSAGSEPVSISVSRSTDGGDTWAAPQHLSPSHNSIGAGGRQGCNVATDSNGVVYVVWEDAVHHHSVMELSRSTDGGKTFSKGQVVAQVTDVGKFDGVRSISFDGVAGARTSSFPSLSIANGAPTGTGAPNTLALGWSDGADGLNHEHALVQLSGDGGQTWTDPTAVEQSGDRPDFAFLGISPNGQDLYVTYDAFLKRFRNTTSRPRPFQGVVRHADVAGTTLSGTSTIDRGGTGDGRASSANALIDEFIGDYNSVAATDGGAVAVFNDARDAKVCPKINAYRQSIVDGSPIAAPAPPTDCPGKFGNTDIWSFVTP